MRRVAVTGLGVISPLGNTDAALWCAALESGRSGVVQLPGPLGTGLRSPVGAPVSLDVAAHFDEARQRILDRVSQLALLAAAQAVADAALDFDTEARERCGVSVGTGMGGAQTTDDGYRTLYAERSDRIKPFSVIAAMANAPAAWLALEYSLSGPALTYSTACSSSAVAIGEAALRIRSGAVDIMLAGGSETRSRTECCGPGKPCACWPPWIAATRRRPAAPLPAIAPDLSWAKVLPLSCWRNGSTRRRAVR